MVSKGYKFPEFTPTMYARLKSWYEQHNGGKCVGHIHGCIGGGLTFNITPTSIGDFVTAKCSCGSRVDLSEEAYGPCKPWTPEEEDKIIKTENETITVRKGKDDMERAKNDAIGEKVKQIVEQEHLKIIQGEHRMPEPYIDDWGDSPCIEWKCPSCGKGIYEDYNYCPHCGQRLINIEELYERY